MFFRALSVSAIAAAFASLMLMPDPSRASGPVSLFQWEDYMDPPFLTEYKKTYHETPNITIFADEDEAFAKMRAGFKPDVMGPCYYEYPRWREAGLLQPIDTTKLKNWNKISPTLRALPGIGEYAKKPSWQILFDPKYKGRIAVLDGVDDTVPFIARMIGIDAYHMTPAQWEKVQNKLRELVKQTRIITSDDTTLVQALASGEIVAAMTWRIVYSALHREGKPVAFMNPPSGIFTYVCGLVTHKNPSDEVKATALIDSMIGDEGADYTLLKIGDEPANVSTLSKIPNATFQNLGISRDAETILKHGIFQQRLKNKEEIVSAWTEIRAGL
jgi:spermidine/putrescine transport system substrate-binding protein